MSLLLLLRTLLPLMVDCASLSLELSADIRDMEEDESCWSDSGRVLPESNREAPHPIKTPNFSIKFEIK